jgi:NAD(P)-dependent dehydrogenase (short-subunit alcohol dehydrogenase family)
MVKKILITGCNGQLGKSIIKRFKNTKKYTQIIGIDIHENNESDCDAYFKCDVTSEKQVKNIWKKIKYVNCLVNNVGIGVFSPTLERSKSDFMKIFETNVYSVHLMSVMAIKSIPENNRLRIINLGSLYGNISSDYRIYGESKRNNSEIYSVSKAGVIALTKYFSTHFGSDLISFNSVSPGGILREQSQDFIENYSYKCPLGRLANVDEISEVICWLGTSSPSYLNGEDILVDGGFSKW